MPVRRLGAAQHLTCERAYSGYENDPNPTATLTPNPNRNPNSNPNPNQINEKIQKETTLEIDQIT